MPQAPPDLDRLFSPRSIAVAGASTRVDSPGHDYVASLREFGFPGSVYPINLKADEIVGYQAFAKLTDVPGEIDLVISCLPAVAVIELIRQCAEKNVPFLHLFTGRLSETGDPEAILLEREIVSAAAASGVRILGPNGMGLYNPSAGVSFRPDLPKAGGSVAFLSQSGNNAVEAVVRGVGRGLRFGKVANYGNGVDLSPGVLLTYLANDDATTVVGAYVEGVPDGRTFFAGLKAAAAKKPVIIHKAGRTQAGAESAASHTAALAGSSQVWSAMLRQAGAIEARTQEELLDLMIAASLLNPPGGPNVAVAGGGGGRSVQSADACEEAGLTVVPLPSTIREQVRERAPMLADWIRNPVDQSILAGSGLSSNRLLGMMLECEEYDFGIANIGEEWFFGRPDAADRLKHSCLRLREVIQETDKAVAVVLGTTETSEAWQKTLVDEVRTDFIDNGLAVFPTVERAAASLSALLALRGE